ncbi:HYR domain-containing protein [Rufibacter sp. LB8]|uniref:HYR domain-containing protein n=1 Tax=Rufibacter sp. LB8 TaxID=2777781 RepID=UPI00178C3307
MTAPTATDGCSGTITATTSGPTTFATQGTHTVTWTYTDAAGNKTTQEQTVVIKDVTPPVISGPFNITVNADPNTCGAKVTYTTPSATDNCGNGNLPTSIPGYTYKGNFGGHAYFISNTATTPEDAHAKAIALGGHLVTISNSQENAFVSAMSPFYIWIGHTDRAVEGQYKWVTSEPVSYTNWNAGEPNNAGGGQGEDWAVINWGPNGTWNDWFYTATAFYVVEFEGGAIPATQVAGIGSGNVFPVGTTTEKWQAVDAGGNVSTVSFTVTVVDNQAPVPTLATLPVVNAECSVTVTAPIALDACKGTITATTNNPLTYTAQGTYTITWTYNDGNGNSVSQSQQVVVKDVTPPVMAAPVKVTAFAEVGKCGAAVALSSPATSDNCSVASVTNNAPAFFPVGTTTVTWTVKDINGLVSTATQEVVVVDNQAPVFAAISNVAVNTDNNVCGAAVTYATPVATDNCAVTTVQIAGLPSASVFPVGATVNTFKATDASGNTSTVSFTVTVTDRQAPAFASIADVAVNTDQDVCGAMVTYVTPVATDNCEVSTVQTAGLASGSVFPVGTTTNTFVATDASGNISTISFKVTVTDKQAPYALAKNISVTLVNGSATISAADVNNGSYDACGIASMSVSRTSFDCSSVTAASTSKEYTVILTVTDVNGNVSSTTAVVTVIGTKPVTSIAVSRTDNTNTGVNTAKTIFLGYGAQSLTLTASNATSAAGATTYSWSPAAGLSSTTAANPVFTPTSAGTYTFTVTATNEFGCSSTATETITVVDARCSAGKSGRMDKVLVCHKGQEICIDASGVAAHLAHGCTIGSCSGTIAVTKSSSLSMAEATGTSTVDVYPNPAIGTVNISVSFGSNAAYTLEVYDLKGSLVTAVSAGTGTEGASKSYDLDLSKYRAGMYLVKLSTESGVITKRLVVAN